MRKGSATAAPARHRPRRPPLVSPGEQLATFEHHGANLAVRPLTTAEIAEYRSVHLIAFPDLWRNP